jgi:Fe-S protein assembly co-chaperone HscB
MTDPFATLGVPAVFALDPAELHRRFIRASAANHPDRFTDPLEQADAAARSAEINEAYRTLGDPELRAGALLERLGGPGKGEDKSLPPDRLVEMMEVRERMEEAIADHDEAELRELALWADAQRAAHLKRIEGLFDASAKTASDQRDALLKAIRLELNALRYFQRMIEQTPDEDEGRLDNPHPGEPRP